jgi:hypothetical protein
LGYLTFNSKIHPTSRFQTLRFRHSALVDFRHSALANFLVHSALPDDEHYIQATLLHQSIVLVFYDLSTNPHDMETTLELPE